jgi:hypothetical protein
MALSDYTGRSPGDGSEASIRRVSRHHHWDLGNGVEGDCAYCGAALNLKERHVLVTLEGAREEGRRYLCDESCLRDWIDED